jgi:hypothetical protein
LGKLPVDLNRIAIARTGKTVIVNELGIIISVVTILSVIPVVGPLLALINMVFTPVFFFQAINGVKNIPYASGTKYIKEEKPAEPLDINSIRDYSQLFNKKQYGVNYMFGLYYFGATLCSQLIMNIIYFVVNDISLLSYFSTSNIINLILYPFLFSLMLVILSHAIRKKVLLALVWGLTSVIIGSVSFLILMMKNYDAYSQFFFSKNNLIQVITNFLSSVLFIVSIVLFIRWYGLKFWSILLSIAIPSVLTHLFYYTAAYFLNEKFDLKVTGLVGLTVHILLFSVAVYFGLYQYVQQTKRDVLTD